MSKQTGKPAVKLAITLNNREYMVNCDAGQEGRLRLVADMVQREMKAVADNVGNSTEQRHLMLACLSLADRLLEAQTRSQIALDKQEDLFVAAVDHLKQRVTHLASQAGRA